MINNSYLLAPWAEVLYFADSRWWEWHRSKKEFLSFAGQKVTIQPTGMLVNDPNIFMLHNLGTTGLSLKPNGLHTGSNGGYQAINLAVLAGAKRVLLLGYDMSFPRGRSHWHEGHPLKHPEQNYTGVYAQNFSTMCAQLKELAVEVINCSIGSAVKCFPFLELDRALDLPK